VFERFTEQARQVIVLAQEESRSLKHDHIGAEHLLLGLVREGQGIAARILDSFDITLEGVRREVVRLVGEGQGVSLGQIPFTAEAKRILELSLREAQSLGDTRIDTEHLLLGLARENAGVTARILDGFGADAEKVRDEVLRVYAELTATQRQRSPGSVTFEVEQPTSVDLSPRARRIWMSAASQALDAGRTEVLPGDLLEPLMSDDNIGWLLTELGVDVPSLRERLRASAWSEPDDPQGA
jgi:ATP-dependent Clp protease ATP-binding subunit ClpA